MAEVVPTSAKPRRFRRGVAILPSIFTTGNLFVGFWALIEAVHQHFERAALLIVCAIILDMLDGRIARLTGTTSEFGAELDSLSDLISFGVTPAVTAYLWGMAAVSRQGWLVAFLFVVCGALRLARFNVQKAVVDGRYFVGLPIPAAAGQVAAVIYVLSDAGRQLPAPVLLALVMSLAFLMVSTFRYRSFKGIDLKQRRSYINVLGIALLFLLVALEPGYALLALSSGYTVSGPLAHLFGLLRRRRSAPVPPPGEPSA